MNFRREIAGPKLFEELAPLLQKHYEEIAHYKDIELDPDWEKYEAIENSGALRVYVARDHESNIVGYSVYYVKHNPHYKNSLQAVQDILFIEPEKRGFGAKFILWCDKQLKEEGVQVTYHHMKSKHNFGPMLERIGYELVDLIYARRLD